MYAKILFSKTTKSNIKSFSGMIWWVFMMYSVASYFVAFRLSISCFGSRAYCRLRFTATTISDPMANYMGRSPLAAGYTHVKVMF